MNAAKPTYRSVRVLHLPGGGTFDLPLPESGARVSGPAPPVLASPSWPSDLLLPILGGAALGGLLTWVLLRLSR
jgi:hypothetical protein